jgi:hypothetical protein
MNPVDPGGNSAGRPQVRGSALEAGPERLALEQELLCGVDGHDEAEPFTAAAFEMLWLTMPITWPFMSNIGPPELPVLMVAVV